MAIDYLTKNNSFLKVHKLLKQKGVKNNAFFLETYDESLIGIDPFDPNLSEETQHRIIIECTKNIWYFIRECVRISASGTSGYELNLGNLAATWACINNFSNILILPRQCGKTFSLAVVYCYILYFAGDHTEMLTVAQNASKIADNMARIKSVRDNLPPYLILKNHKDRDGSELMDFKLLGNKLTNTTPGISRAAADSKGRGCSLPCVWIDEGCFCDNIESFYKAAVLAQTTVAKRAQKKGLPNFISFTTTAGYLNQESGIFMYNFLNNSFQFTDELYDYPIEEIRKLIRNEAKRNFLFIEYEYWDLGKGDEYYDEQCKALFYNKDDIDREILNKWKTVSTVHPLGQEALALLSKHARNPNHIIVLNKIFRMKFYKDPETLDWGRPYVISGDCSNNVGADYSALVVTDPYTYEIVATVRTNMFSTMLFGKMIADLMTKYFYKSIAVIESNLNGLSVMDKIVEENSDLLSRIYGEVDPKTKEVKKLGFLTGQKSREILYGEILKIVVDDSYDRIYDKVIINEIESLITGRNGRIDHPVGGHDDLLISMLIGRWFLLYGDNIDRYIDPLLIGCLVGDFRTANGDEQVMQSICNEKLKKIEYDKLKQKKESERHQKSFTVMNVKEQHDAIMNADPTYNGIADRFVTSKSEGASIQGVFDKLQSMEGDRRIDETLNQQLEDQDDDGTLYTLDDDELAKENNNLFDENYQRIQYNQNMREDMGIKAHPIISNNQFIRKQEAKFNEDDNLKFFFNSLHRR